MLNPFHLYLSTRVPRVRTRGFHGFAGFGEFTGLVHGSRTRGFTGFSRVRGFTGTRVTRAKFGPAGSGSNPRIQAKTRGFAGSRGTRGMSKLYEPLNKSCPQINYMYK